MQCLRETTEGAWNTMLALDPSERGWVEKVEIDIELMNDGATPMTLHCKLHLKADDIGFPKGKLLEFELNQITGKAQGFIASTLRNVMLLRFHQALETEISLCRGHLSSLQASLQRTSELREPIRRTA